MNYKICANAPVIIRLAHATKEEEEKTALGFFIRAEKTVMNGVEVSIFHCLIRILTFL